MSLNTPLDPFVAGATVAAAELNELVDALNGLQAAADPWVPTWTGVTLGTAGAAATVVARFQRVGKWIDFRLSFVAGLGTTFSGAIAFSLPTPQRGDYVAGVDVLGAAMVSRGSAASRTAAVAYLGGGSTCQLVVDGHDATNGYTSSSRVVSSLVPWTWSPGDTLAVTGRYEAA